MNWDIETDTLCVGSGLGGVSAAIRASESGLSAIVIEKDSKLGGVTALSGGQLWAGNSRFATQLGVQDSYEEALAYLEGISAGLGINSLRKNFVRRSAEAIEYFVDCIKIPLEVIRDWPDYYFPKIPGSKAEGRYFEIAPYPAIQLGDWAEKCIVSPYSRFASYVTSGEFASERLNGESFLIALRQHVERDERCRGAGLMASLIKAALDRGVQFWTDSPAVRLINDGGRVAGAIVATPGGHQVVRARLGVVLATGGYDWDTEFVRTFEAWPESHSMCPPTVEGDHLRMAAEFGALAMTARASSQTPIAVGYYVPTERIHGGPTYRSWKGGYPHSMIVNRYGHRFADESFYPDMVSKIVRFDGQDIGYVNFPAWAIFDDSFREKYSLLPYAPGQDFPEGFVTTADSLRLLSERTGIERTGLEDSVARINRYCVTGIDEDFNRGQNSWSRLNTGDPAMPRNPNLGPIEKPPFHALSLARVMLGVPTAGLKIDEEARVINASGEPVMGLFAAGNSAAWLDIGGGYNSGISNTRGMLYGYLAALHMAGTSMRNN